MNILPDVLTDGLDVVFCGTAAGKYSAKVGHYYAHPRNRFWKALHDAGFTDRQISPCDYRDLLNHKIGLTDLIKDKAGPDREVVNADLEKARKNLSRKIEKYQPKVIAFTGKQPAEQFLSREEFDYGSQEEKIGNTILWVLPSPSSANAHWDIEEWVQFKLYLGSISEFRKTK